MKHQINTIREALEFFECGSYSTSKALTALTAISELDRMAGEPVLFIHPIMFGVDSAHVCAWKPGHELEGYVPLYRATPPAQQPQEEHLTITWDEQQTRILAVTMQDEEGRILKVLAEAPAQQPHERHLLNLLARIHGDGGHYTAEHGLEKSVSDADQKVADLHLKAWEAQQPQYEAGDMASAHNDGFRAGVASAAQQPLAEKRCQYCDGTGDVHSVDGQWRGECNCQKQPQARPDFTDEWTGYLKDGETPFERFLRERKDLNALTKLYQRALEENERLKAQQQQQAEVGNSGFDHKTAADFLSGKTVSDEAVRKFVQASRWAYDDRASLQSLLLSVRNELASREAEIALLKKELMEAEAAHQQAEAVPSDVVRDAMVEAAYDAVAAALGDAYDCTRCWSAWSYGTMGPDDFSQVAEDGDRVREIAGAAIDAAMAQGEKP